MFTISRLIGFILIGLLIVSCSSNEKPIKNESLIGDWELVKATRDGIETETLSGLFFYFQDSVVRTNFRGVGEEELSYALEGSTITLNQDERMQLNIQTIDKASLVVQLDIKDIDFKLWLNKK